jgi:hypothetical protein
VSFGTRHAPSVAQAHELPVMVTVSLQSEFDVHRRAQTFSKLDEGDCQ